MSRTTAFPERRSRRELDGEAALREPLAACAALGARPAAALIRRRLRLLGAQGVPRGPRPATRANQAGLTGREVEVAISLAAGATNQEIAQRLYLSRRTVEYHVAAIFAKLGVTTRAEAALAVQQQGLITSSE